MDNDDQSNIIFLSTNNQYTTVGWEMLLDNSHQIKVIRSPTLPPGCRNMIESNKEQINYSDIENPNQWYRVHTNMRYKLRCCGNHMHCVTIWNVYFGA